ncbi:MAG: hypothetical protein ACOC11_01845, partial [Prolixibacteraceae bacterium]
MSENEIWQKIARKLADQPSREEESAINDWCNETNQNKRIHTILTKVWEYNPVSYFDSSAIFNRFRQ